MAAISLGLSCIAFYYGKSDIKGLDCIWGDEGGKTNKVKFAYSYYYYEVGLF